MIKIFISYRREDAPYAARHINDALCQRFGKRNVYFDLDANQPGLDFRKQIDERVAKCDVMLVIIGDRWLQAPNSQDSRLLNPDDLVAWEVASALERNIPVIPVLVQSATIPAEEVLPDTVKPLVFRHAVEIRATENFKAGFERLVDSIKSATFITIPKAKAGFATKLKTFLQASILLTAVQHILAILYVDSPKNFGMGFFVLGYLFLLVLGIFISVNSYFIHFKIGVYKGVLIPIVGFPAWFIVYAILWNTPMSDLMSLTISFIVSAIFLVVAYIGLLRTLHEREQSSTKKAVDNESPPIS